MYRVIKVLNNNSVLVFNEERKKEYILLGNGIGFGKKTSERFEKIENSKVYSLVTRQKKQSAIKAVNGINPIYIEATAKIINNAEKEFSTINRGILIPLADHISLAIERAKDNVQFDNPLNSDIKMTFSKEFDIALKGRDILKNITGYELSESEVGFIALHIHSGITGSHIQDTLNITNMINHCMSIIDENYKTEIIKDSLGYNRLKSYIYYIISRVIKNEDVDIDINEFIKIQYPKASNVSYEVCSYMEKMLNKEIIKNEQGLLAIHIQRAINIKK